jgi:hypothetical protein
VHETVDLVRAIALAVGELGGSGDVLLERSGSARRAWELAETLTGDPLFGLHAAMDGLLGGDELDRIVRDARTVEHALHQTASYFCTLDPACRLRVDPLDDGVRCSVAGGPRHASEHYLATLIARSRAFSGLPLEPRAVCFEHARPRQHRELDQFFGCRIEWDTDENVLELDDFVVQRFARGSS